MKYPSYDESCWNVFVMLGRFDRFWTEVERREIHVDVFTKFTVKIYKER